MQKTTVRIDKDTVQGGRPVDRWVCNRGHPHPTYSGANDCEIARAMGSTDEELLAMFEAEVAAFNA